MTHVAASNHTNVYIAGWKTAADWTAFRETLVIGGDAETWQRAFQEYFQARLDLRHLSPVRILQKHGTFQGEGFSILALQCTLIEFLESTVQGVNYQYRPPGEQRGSYEYNSTSDVFASFLCNRYPFARDFDEALAREFYREIRCGLLHEARTKGGWKVWAEAPDGKIVDRERRIVYRNNFQNALDEFIRWYNRALPHNVALQDAFIRKFNNLCE